MKAKRLKIPNSKRSSKGVESNIELAAEKMYFREVQEQFHITKYKLPGDHLMSARQAEENLAQYYADIQLKAEMPPICVARPDIKTEISHKSKMFEKLDGSDFVLTDVSPARPHENRPMLLREKVTGKLKYADWDRRDRLLQVKFSINKRHIRNIYYSMNHELKFLESSYFSRFVSTHNNYF